MAASPHIAEVSQTDFADRVVEQSRRLPVLVDFWAPWCGPCRMLTPILERLADEYAGKLFVAKVNTDVEQELAMQYRIRGIPAVKLFRNGEVAGEFVGVQPESTIRALIDQFVPNEMDALVEKAAALHASGQTAEATSVLREAVDKEPKNDRAKLALANLLCEQAAGGDASVLEDCQKLLDSLSIRAAANPEVEQARTRLSMARIAADAPAVDTLERAVAENPADLQARYRLAARFTLAGRYESAMEQFLEIVRRDRKFEDDAGRKGLVGIFHLLSSQDPLVIKYRTLLSRAIS